MTQTYNEEVVINDNLLVDGAADETQVVVQGHSTQTAPLQTWEDSAGNDLAKVTGDGRMQVGSFDAQGEMATDDALIEAYRDKADTTKPKRGLHTAGEIEDDTSAAVAWSVHELTLSGTNTTTGKATALSTKIAIDDADIDTAVGLEVAVDVEGTGSIDEAVGIEVADINQGTTNYAIRTGSGTVQLGSLDDGLVKSDANGNLSIRKDNYAATTAPTINDDAEDGYEVGSRWIDTTNDKEYVCFDTTSGASVWLETTPTSAELSVTTDTIWTRTTIFDETLSSAGDFDTGANGIPTDYDWLEFQLINARSDRESADADTVQITVNGDTTASNYRRLQDQVDQTIGSIVSDSNRYVGVVPATNINSGHLAEIFGYITHRGSSRRAHIYTEQFYFETTSDKRIRHIGINWSTTDEITRVAVGLENGNFIAGSRLIIVGVKEKTFVTDISGDVLTAMGDQDEGSLITWDSNQKATVLAPGAAGQVLTSNGTNVQPTWQAASGGGSGQWLVGDYKYRAAKSDFWPSLPTWLRCDGRDFGKGSSGATIADDNLETLFSHLWAEFGDTELPMYTDNTLTTTVARGANGNSVSDDWNAGYCMLLPDMRGSVAMMMDDPTGGDAKGNVSASWADVLGGSGGAETHTQIVSESPSHRHQMPGRDDHQWISGWQRYLPYQATINIQWYQYTNYVGGSGAHNNMQPTIAAGNYFIYTGN